MSVQVQPGRDASAAGSRAFLDGRVAASNRDGEAYFARHAHDIAACAAAMADRFFAGGMLLVFGSGPHATDAQHNSVEFVHPVLPGCRALPALSLTNDIATITGGLDGDAASEVYAHQLRVLGRPGDIALALAHAPLPESITRGLSAATGAGMLTIALLAGHGDGCTEADFVFHATCADRDAAHEMHLATYHMLWELVHIVLNHRGIGAGS
ncbi:MAG TPA: SIS domain-containing protein [Candidatus Saccharimonadales bacterium]|nr:SIS domain-containing protein [Candidatus Saccharimonadales bacterium]